MESHPQNPEFRINPENFHTCIKLNLYFGCSNNLLIFLSLAT